MAHPLLGKEVSALKGLFGEIRKAEAELEIMRAYLRDSEKFKDANETTSIFVRRVRDVAFRIEDVVDEFTYTLEDCKHGGLATRIKKRIKHAMNWRRLALKLRNVNAELEDAVKKEGALCDAKSVGEIRWRQRPSCRICQSNSEFC